MEKGGSPRSNVIYSVVDARIGMLVWYVLWG